MSISHHRHHHHHFNYQYTLLCCHWVTAVGKIGSGKSSLLAGLLSEMTVSQADEAAPKFGYQLKGRTAYISQSAWIQNLTLRENILFGKVYTSI